MALVPFPPATAPVARPAALEALKQAGQGVFEGWQDADLVRLADMVSARITKYAPDAPESVKDEAMVRACAWLSQSLGVGPIQAETMHDKSYTHDVRAPAAWFRLTGAQSMLAPWRVKTFVAI